jgi:hypothetical protein
MLSPLTRTEQRTRPLRSENSSFEAQRRATDLRHREEAVADERARLAQERREFERARSEWEEQQQQRAEQQRIEQHTERRRVEAEAIAGDLGHDIDRDRPGHTASLILEAGRKARGLSGAEEPTGIIAEILRARKLALGEIVAEVPLETPAARAIILSGRRARGEILSESDAAFLSAFLQRLEHDRRHR